MLPLNTVNAMLVTLNLELLELGQTMRTGLKSFATGYRN
jgi:hypothetical protein